MIKIGVREWLAAGLISTGLISAGLIFAPSATIAEVPVVYTENGRELFTVNAPDFWTIRSGGDAEIEAPAKDSRVSGSRVVSRVLGFEPDEGGVWLGFVVPDGVSNLADSYDYLDEIANFLVQDPVSTGTQDRSISGRAAHVIRGTGRRFGETIGWTVTVIDLPGSKVAIGIAIVEASADPAQIEALNTAFASFRVGR